MGNPPWTNKYIKELIHNKIHAYVCYHQNKNNLFSFHKFQISWAKAKARVRSFRISPKKALKNMENVFLLLHLKLLFLLPRYEKFCNFSLLTKILRF